MFERLAKIFGVEPTFQFRFVISFIATAIIMFFLYLGTNLIELSPETAEPPQACSSEGLVSKCYTLSQDSCVTVWDRFQNECAVEVKKKYEGKAVSVLPGPIVKKCTLKKLDKAFRSQRKTPENSECQAHFSSLDALSID
jgi:hypothetical protein